MGTETQEFDCKRLKKKCYRQMSPNLGHLAAKEKYTYDAWRMKR